MSQTIDTLGLAKRLQEHGFTREQAEGLAEALGSQGARLVTVPVLDERLRDLEQRLTIRMGYFALGIIGALSTVNTILHFVR